MLTTSKIWTLIQRLFKAIVSTAGVI